MRRTTAATAALIAASSIALIAPSVQAAPVPQRLTATASCDGGGQVRLVSSIGANGTQRGKATVRGVKEKHWAGELLVGLDEKNVDDIIDAITSSMKQYTAKHGGFSTSSTSANSTTNNAMGMFVSKTGKAMCEAAIATRGGNKWAAIGMTGGIAVKAGPKPQVTAFALGQQHHRYRFVLTAHTKTGTKRWTAVRTAAHKSGTVQLTVRNAWHLPSFDKVSATVTDLTKHDDPLRFKLSR